MFCGREARPAYTAACMAQVTNYSLSFCSVERFPTYPMLTCTTVTGGYIYGFKPVNVDPCDRSVGGPALKIPTPVPVFPAMNIRFKSSESANLFSLAC